MVDGFPHLLRYRLVDFIGVHDRRDDIFLAVNPTGETVGFFIERSGILIAAPFLKVPCVHVNDQFIEDCRSLFLSSGGDFALVDELLKKLVVGQTACVLEVDIEGRTLQIHIDISVAFVFALVVPFDFLRSRSGDFIHSDNAEISFRQSHHLQFCGKGGGRLRNFFKVRNPL